MTNGPSGADPTTLSSRTVPSRPLPVVRVVTDRAATGVETAATPGWRAVPEDATGTRGRAEEARVEDRDGALLVVVDREHSSPRPGWSGTVDHGLGHRRAGAALARHLRDRRATDEVTLRAADWGPAERLHDVVLGYLLGAHRQDAFAADPAPTAPDLVVEVGPDGGGDDDEGAISGAVAAAEEAAHATVLARALAGAPADLKTPEWLTSRMAEQLQAAGMTTQVLSGVELEEGGFGGVLAVGGGSAHPPRVLVARRPGTGTRVLLVGKGITFDTGGISVKPATDMHLMRTDMAGSAAVVAAAAAFCAGSRADAGRAVAPDADLDLTVVVPSAENMLSGSAYRPGDVVTHVGGTTSEVTNTDAEGRMVLADGLAHGIAECDPDVIVDVATLTGAMKIALGMRTGAVMGTSDDLADRIAAAGAASGERWWRLPLPDEHRDAVRSSIADRRQAPKGPGAITAALFLEGFVEGRPWVHLDIAGPARSPEEIDEVGPVATGFATRTLLGFFRGLVDRPYRD